MIEKMKKQMEKTALYPNLLFIYTLFKKNLYYLISIVFNHTA